MTPREMEQARLTMLMLGFSDLSPWRPIDWHSPAIPNGNYVRYMRKAVEDMYIEAQLLFGFRRIDLVPTEGNTIQVRDLSVLVNQLDRIGVFDNEGSNYD